MTDRGRHEMRTYVGIVYRRIYKTDAMEVQS